MSRLSGGSGTSCMSSTMPPATRFSSLSTLSPKQPSPYRLSFLGLSESWGSPLSACAVTGGVSSLLPSCLSSSSPGESSLNLPSPIPRRVMVRSNGRIDLSWIGHVLCCSMRVFLPCSGRTRVGVLTTSGISLRLRVHCSLPTSCSGGSRSTIHPSACLAVSAGRTSPNPFVTNSPHGRFLVSTLALTWPHARIGCIFGVLFGRFVTLWWMSLPLRGLLCIGPVGSGVTRMTRLLGCLLRCLLCGNWACRGTLWPLVTPQLTPLLTLSMPRCCLLVLTCRLSL